MKPVIVADSSVLIAFAKMQKLGLLKRLYDEVLVGPAVKSETVDAGKVISAAGVHHIEKALADGWIRVARPSGRVRKLIKEILSKSRLDLGEAESIALAAVHKLPVILDDKEARGFADALGIEFLGTAAVLLLAFNRGHLTFAGLCPFGKAA